jgi:hypothetical protein
VMSRLATMVPQADATVSRAESVYWQPMLI